ncbi:MAG: hypothetical protein ACR2OR_11475 [Hyphomicrobiales bacterium]
MGFELLRVFGIWTANAIALCLALSQAAQGQDKTFKVVEPPACENNKGETVRFVDSDKGRAGLAAGMAIRDKDGAPVVFRSNFQATTPEYQLFIDRHECAHHQTGDVDRPHPPRNSPEHLMNEAISDCVAILRLRDENGYGRTEMDKVTAAMRGDMAKIGFPEISMSSRISNIENCHGRFRSAQEIIDRVLKERDLYKP